METGNKLNVSYGLIVEQKRQIEAGNFDVAITPSEVIDGEIKAAKIDSASAAIFARTGLGVGVKAGAPKPDLSSADAFKAALLAAKSFSFAANEPSGKTSVSPPTSFLRRA